MKLKNREIILALSALKAINTLKKSPKAVYAFAKSLHALSDALKPIEEAQKALFKEHFQEAQTVDAKHPKFAEYQTAAKVIDDQETEVALHMMTQADLNLAENEIHHDHLAAIRFIISDW